MFKNSKIPIWVNLFLIVIILLMVVQVFQFYFGHQTLLDAGISIQSVADLNIIYTTAGRLTAMAAASIFVLITQNPYQHLVIWLMSIFREGQEMFIDPLFPYANAPASPMVDFGVHVVIIALEIAAFVVVYRITRQDNNV